MKGAVKIDPPHFRVSANGEGDRQAAGLVVEGSVRQYPSVSRLRRLPPPHLSFGKMGRIA